MTGGHDLGTALGEPLDRRQRGTDSEVVGDRAVRRHVERHVEVGADEHPLAGDVAEILQGGNPVDHLMTPAVQRLTFEPTYSVDVDEAVGVAPLVVVPAVDLDELAHAHREAGVEDRRVRVARDVARHDRVLGVPEHALERLAGGRLLVRRVDLLDRGLLLEVGGEVGERPVGIGTRSDVPSSLPFIDSITRRVARAAPVEVGTMLIAAARARRRSLWGRRRALVAGVRVHRRHQALLDAERVVEHLDERDEAVRRAARVRDHLVLPDAEVLVVDAVHERRVGVPHGADTITSGAPASRWAAAVSRLVKKPVDSITTSTPRSPHGRSAGSRSLSMRIESSPTRMPFLVALIFSATCRAPSRTSAGAPSGRATRGRSRPRSRCPRRGPWLPGRSCGRFDRIR